MPKKRDFERSSIGDQHNHDNSLSGSPRPIGHRSESGYGNPPRHTRFRPGQSGNPKGRPKGVRNFKTDVKATLEAVVRLKREGKERNISTQSAMLLRLREKALNGDVRALDRLISLAQAYNNDEVIASTDLSANDAELLELYRTRVLSGAASGGGSGEEADTQRTKSKSAT